MIMSSLRRTVLAAATAAALSLPAAAQTDAAFASALGKVPSGLATMAQLKTVSQKPAEDPLLGPPVPNAAWMKIIDTAHRWGKYEAPAPGEELGNWSMTDDIRDPKSEFVQMSIQMVGLPVDQVTISIGMVFFTAIKRTATASGVHAEAWIYGTDDFGQVKSVSYQELTATLDGKITNQVPPKNLDTSDPKVAARYDAIIKYWSER